MAAGQLTLLQVRTNAKQKADMENSTFISDTEWNFNINQSLQELYDLVLQKYGDDYYSTTISFQTDGSTYLYPLPDGTNYSGATIFYKLLGVDLAMSNTNDSYVTIRRFNMSDRNRYAVPNFQSFYGVTNMRYRLEGNNLWITPTPSAGQTMRVWYVPRCTLFSSDSDTSDGYGGWLEYVITDAAIKALQKAELDVSTLAGQKGALLQRIESVAENRDAANPMVVADNLWSDMGWPYGGGSGMGGPY